MASPATDTVQTTVNSTAGNSIQITKPTGVVDTDLMVAHIEVANNVFAILGPSGWTEEELIDHDGGQTSIWFKVAGAAEPADYTWTWPLGFSKNIGGIVRITGHDQATPVAVSPAMAIGTSAFPNPPSADPGSSKDYLSLAFAGIEGKNAPFAPPPGYVEEWDIETAGGGPGTGHCAQSMASLTYTGQVEDPGAFIANGSDGWAAATIIIAPAGAGGVTVTLTAATVAASASALVVSVARIITLTPATVTASASALVVSRAVATVTLAAATMAASASALVVSVARIITLIPAVAALSAAALVVTVGRLITLTPAVAASSAAALVVTVGRLITLTPAVAASSAAALVVSIARLIQLSPATAVSSAVALVVSIAGAVSGLRRLLKHHHGATTMRQTTWRRPT